MVSKWNGGGNCAFLPWPWSDIVVSEKSNTPPPPLPPPSKHALRPHYTQVRSEWRLLHDSDLTLNSFLSMFIFVCYFHDYFFLKRRRSVNCQLMFKIRIKALFYFLVFTHFRECFKLKSKKTSRSCHFKSSFIPLENKARELSFNRESSSHFWPFCIFSPMILLLFLFSSVVHKSLFAQKLNFAYIE